VIFCSLNLAACTGTTSLGDLTSLTNLTKLIRPPRPPEPSVPAPSELDYMDKQKVELQSSLGRFEGTQIERLENGVYITIGCDLLFESDAERIRPDSCLEMDTVAEVVNKYPETSIKVDVHTDCVRSEEENLALSELQAWIIKKALVDKGVAPSRVTARGWGESKPVASNATEAGRKANRRVTITLAPNTQS
jgi:outer membrane protein OmpA-like peptidoglycan-associated protein